MNSRSVVGMRIGRRSSALIRIPTVKRGTRDEMIGLGWEPDTATRLIGMDDLRHSPDMRRVATRSGVAPDADKMQSLIRLLQALP
jgi:hypothetical protein